MRITNHQSTQNAIAAFSTARERLDDALRRVSTGRKFETASEDPTSALTVMQNDGQSRAIDQYRRNIDTATARVSLEDGVLDSLTSLLTRAKELAIGQASDTSTPATRAASAAEANQLLAQAIQLASTKQSGEYVFGGDRSTTVPFTLTVAPPAYTFAPAVPPATGGRAIEVAPGQTVTASHDGTQVFGDAASGPLASLQALAAALASGNGAAVSAAIPSIDNAIASTQALVAETGARANQLTNLAATHSLQSLELAAHTSNLQEVDLETALTELATRQTALQAAMAATVRVLSLSLTDYI